MPRLTAHSASAPAVRKWKKGFLFKQSDAADDADDDNCTHF
jgi:hypothetical protein